MGILLKEKNYMALNCYISSDHYVSLLGRSQLDNSFRTQEQLQEYQMMWWSRNDRYDLDRYDLIMAGSNVENPVLLLLED